MSQVYSDPSRESEPTALPDIETYYQGKQFSGCYLCEGDEDIAYGSQDMVESHKADHVGWYWQACFPGCLPGGDPMGPFETEADAIADAQEGSL